MHRERPQSTGADVRAREALARQKSTGTTPVASPYINEIGRIVSADIGRLVPFFPRRLGLNGERVPPGQRSTKDEHLPVERRELRHRSRSYWVERAAAMGPEVERFIEEVFDSDDVVYQLRVAQQIVRLLEGYPVDRARAACRRARFYGNYSYGGLKNILVRALDLEPLPSVVLDHAAEPGARPRFARDVQELLQLPLEKNDASH